MLEEHERSVRMREGEYSRNALPLSHTILLEGVLGEKVKPKTWRILAFANVISMTTGLLSSCELPLTSRDPKNLTEAFPLPKIFI